MSDQRIVACFVDIDGTLTGDRATPQIAPDRLLGNALFEIIRDLMVEQGRDRVQAEAAIKALADRIVFWDYPDFVTEFNLPAAEVWRRFAEWHQRELIVHADAVAMVRELKQAGYKLYLASNNPLVGCLFKLQRAGLGDLSGTPWFDRIFCANLLRGQKGVVDWWRRALAQTPHDPARVVIIGDSDREDHLVPAQAGFQRFIIVDRQQAEPARTAAGAHFVNDLRQVAAIWERL